MKSVMRYVSQPGKTFWDSQNLISGIGCQPETAFDEFLSTKLLHHKDGGVMFYHMVQSFQKARTLTRAQSMKRRGGLPDTLRAVKSSSAPTPTVNIFIHAASSTVSCLSMRGVV